MLFFSLTFSSLFFSWCYKQHTMVYFDEDTGKTSITYRPVHYYTLDKSEMDVVAPVARVY